MQGLWEIVMGYCLRPVSTGGGVYFLLDSQEFNSWLEGIGYDRKTNIEDYEDLVSYAKDLIEQYQDINKEVTWDKKDHDFLRQYDKEYTQQLE